MTEDTFVKPCPFCGEDTGFAGMTPDAFCKGAGTFAVGCHCGATGPLVPTVEEAVTAWNTRSNGEAANK